MRGKLGAQAAQQRLRAQHDRERQQRAAAHADPGRHADKPADLASIARGVRDGDARSHRQRNEDCGKTHEAGDSLRGGKGAGVGGGREALHDQHAGVDLDHRAGRRNPQRCADVQPCGEIVGARATQLARNRLHERDRCDRRGDRGAEHLRADQPRQRRRRHQPRASRFQRARGRRDGAPGAATQPRACDGRVRAEGMSRARAPRTWRATRRPERRRPAAIGGAEVLLATSHVPPSNTLAPMPRPRTATCRPLSSAHSARWRYWAAKRMPALSKPSVPAKAEEVDHRDHRLPLSVAGGSQSPRRHPLDQEAERNGAQANGRRAHALHAGSRSRSTPPA